MSEQQKVEEITRLQQTLTTLLEEAGHRTKTEVTTDHVMHAVLMSIKLHMCIHYMVTWEQVYMTTHYFNKILFVFV